MLCQLVDVKFRLHFRFLFEQKKVQLCPVMVTFSRVCCSLCEQRGFGNQLINCDLSFLKKMILCSVILSGLCHKIAIYHAGISHWTSSVQSLGTKSSAQRVWNNHHPSRCFHAHLGNADRRCDLTPFEWQLLPLSEILIYIRLKARLRKFVSECYTELLSSTPKDTLYLLVICSIHLNIDRESLAALR